MTLSNTPTTPITLTLGANTAISAKVLVRVHIVDVAGQLSGQLGRIRQQIGLVWLPLTSERKIATSPAYLHEPKDWAKVADETEGDVTWQLELPTLWQHDVAYVQLLAYVYQDPSMNLPAVELPSIGLTVSDSHENASPISYDYIASERHIKSAIILEIYQRNGQFKCRALGEASTQGLTSLEKRLEVSIDTRPPHTHNRIQAEQNQHHPTSPIYGHDTHRLRPPRTVQAGETWTGTAFAIDTHHLLTCQHVIESATRIGIRQQGQSDLEAQVVMSDVGSDTAILRVAEPLPHYLPLATGFVDMLGETVTTLGFPLSGLSSQLQVTQGCVSSLTGFGDDIRYVQFTAPIQPGSSGSPLLLPTGQVMGMVTSSLVHEHAQNMNYAVKVQLLWALLASAGVAIPFASPNMTNIAPLTTPKLSRQSRQALWLVGCRA